MQAIEAATSAFSPFLLLREAVDTHFRLRTPTSVSVAVLWAGQLCVSKCFTWASRAWPVCLWQAVMQNSSYGMWVENMPNEANTSF